MLKSTNVKQEQWIKGTLNPSQISIAESAFGFIEDKLDDYLKKSLSSSSVLKGFFFVLHVCLNCDGEATESIAEMIYKNSSSKLVIPFFVKLNQLINGNDMDYIICKQITAPQLMVDKSFKAKRLAIQAFGKYIKQRIMRWLKTDGRENLYTEGEIDVLLEKHSDMIHGYCKNQNPF